MSDHVRRTLAPALISGAVAGVAWWLIVALRSAITHATSAPDLFGIVRAVVLVEIATIVPNLLGLAAVSWFITRRPSWAIRVSRWWFVIGVFYGLGVLVIGVVLGLAIMLGPPWIVMSVLIADVPPLRRLVVPILTIVELYPVGAVAGVAALKLLARNVGRA